MERILHQSLKDMVGKDMECPRNNPPAKLYSNVRFFPSGLGAY
jgi:hypothetical protein